MDYLYAMKELIATEEALRNQDFQAAYDHCLNAQAEIRLLSTTIKTWIPTKEE